MTSKVGMAFLRRRRQSDQETRAAVRTVVRGDATAVFFENAAGNGQSESGPGLFRSRKGREQSASHLRRDARAGVADGDPDGARRLRRQFHVQAPTLRHGVQRIHEKIDEDRTHLPAVDETDGRLLKPVTAYLD